MRFPVRLSPPATAAAATAAAVLAAVALRSYLHTRSSMATSAHRRGSAGGITLVVSGKSTEDQHLLATATGGGSLALGEEDSVEEITVSLDSGAGAGFDAGAYMAALRASRFGRWMLWSPRLASTHDLVTQNFAKLPVGVVCVADVQFKGRGRSKNVWESPPGCLMFSFTSQKEDARKLPLMQYVVCLAMTEAIKELCCAKGLPELDVKIKWPNDLYLKGLKVGGILCTSSYQPKVYNICTGIGLNVDNEEPTTCLNAALKEMKANSSTLKREDILASFFNKFEVLFEIFTNEGFQALEEQYYNSWLHSGQKVVVQDGPEAQRADSVVTIQGLTPAGYLYAIGEDGKSYELHPDGNRVSEKEDGNSLLSQDIPEQAARCPWLQLLHESNSTHLLLRPQPPSLPHHRLRSALLKITKQPQ
uniref:BPL/LPL catalytic domain-containing protein n=1 Tax=Oryza punctata TaxID=4537 RepID=A0A0E0JVZ5_ORYPU